MLLLILMGILFGTVLPTAQESLIDRLCKIDSTLTRCRIRHRDVSLGSRSGRIVLKDLGKDDQNFLRFVRQSGDDPSCKTLKTEYDQVCFTAPPVQAFKETKAFCDAFVETCPETLKSNLFTHLTELHVDYSAYCNAEKERFEYVCPQPLRFRTFAEQAVAFCIRYKDRCPNARVPDRPVSFRKEDERHIFIREIQAYCDANRHTAQSCFHTELLRYPKYAIPCAMWKMNCVDVYTKVIYG